VSILESVQQQLGPNEIAKISEQIGADPAKTREAVQTALPMIVGGMAGTAQQPGGASTIHGLLGSHGGWLDNLGGLISGGGAADGGILGQVLGGHQKTVETGVEQHTALNGDQTRKLLAILTPMVLAFLAKRHAGASQAEVGGALQQEAQRAQQDAERTSPQVGGILGKILSHVQSPRGA